MLKPPIPSLLSTIYGSHTHASSDPPTQVAADSAIAERLTPLTMLAPTSVSAWLVAEFMVFTIPSPTASAATFRSPVVGFSTTPIACPSLVVAVLRAFAAVLLRPVRRLVKALNPSDPAA